MSENVVVPEEKIPAWISLRHDIADQVAILSPNVRKSVVDRLAGIEIEKRQDAVLKVFEKIEEKNKELRKSEAQGAVTFSLKGEPVGDPTFTKQQLEGMKKLREEIEKLQNTLAKAFDNNDYKKLYEVAN